MLLSKHSLRTIYEIRFPAIQRTLAADREVAGPTILITTMQSLGPYKIFCHSVSEHINADIAYTQPIDNLFHTLMVL